MLTCPRRYESAFYAGPKEDAWREERGYRFCSYCGSCHPEDFFKAVEAGAKVTPTDKNYKAYIELPESSPDELRVVSATSFAPEGRGNWLPINGEIRKMMERDGWRGAHYQYAQLAPRGPTRYSKFYFQHLTDEEQERFIEFLNAKKFNLAFPGHFYRLPFFIVASHG